MKNIFLSLSFVVLCGFGIGCVSASADAQVVVNHSFTSPNDIPGCPVGYAAICASQGAVTVALPPFTQNIHIKMPAGASASADITELDVTTTAGGFDFVQELTVSVSAPDLPTIQIVDYKPASAPSKEMQIFPDRLDLVPYIEAPSTTFTVAVTGTIPSEEVPLDVAITIDGEASYKRGL